MIAGTQGALGGLPLQSLTDDLGDVSPWRLGLYLAGCVLVGLVAGGVYGWFLAAVGREFPSAVGAFFFLVLGPLSAGYAGGMLQAGVASAQVGPLLLAVPMIIYSAIVLTLRRLEWRRHPGRLG